MTSEIDKLKHFHIENYSGTNFTDDLNDGEEFLYTTIRCKNDKEVTLLCKYVKNKHIGNCPDCVFNKYLCYGLLCNIVVLKVIKDEESKRYIKKQNNKPLINKKVLAKVMGRRFYGFNNRFRTTKNTEAIVFENGGFVGNLGLSKKLWKKYIEASYKYRTNTDKMTASDYTHLFGYLNPYYRSAYNVSKRRK